MRKASCAVALFAKLGMPISTTHVLTSSVAGGAVSAKGAASLNITLLAKIGLAWVLTLPVSAALAAAVYWATSLIA